MFCILYKYGLFKYRSEKSGAGFADLPRQATFAGAVVTAPAAGLLLHDDPDRMNDAGNVAAQRQQNVQPEMQAKTDLKKNTDRRQENGKENTDNVQDPGPYTAIILGQ